MLGVRHCQSALALVLLGLAAGAAFAQDRCGNFCSLDWWESASASNVKEEIARGADINGADENNWTPLLYALEAEASPEIVFLLVENGADVNASAKPDGTTPLAIAVFKHPLKVAEHLISHGATPTEVSPRGETALHYAAANPDPEVAALLLNLRLKATSLDKNRRTPLHVAAHSNSNPEVARLLLENGASLEAQDRLQRTAWDTALLNRDPRMLAFLTEQGAKVNTQKNFGGYKALHFAVRPFRSGGVAELLIKYGANISAVDEEWGGTPLHWSQANPVTSKLLLENGADTERRDGRGRTPLFWSAVKANQSEGGVLYAEYLDVMEVLLDGGADANATDNQGRPLLIAALMAHADPEAISMLLERGADPNKSDGWACAPLSVAKHFYEDSGEMEALLVRHGAEGGFSSYPGYVRCMYNILSRSDIEST